jgi:hypothetical protein
MKLTIEIDCGNAAFEDYPGELGRILRQVETMIDRGRGFPIPLYDTNGNKVGQVKRTGRRKA